MRLDPAGFEALYAADADPWDFATSAYEQAKYAATLAAVPEGHVARALECGCSIGVFTERLAERCAELVAFDASPTAVAAARERLAGVEHVDLRVAVLPEELPTGSFDLITCSEILYYFARSALETVLDALVARLAPGGSLLLVHWRPATRTYPLRGDEVHAIAAQRLAPLDHAVAEAMPEYRLDRYDRSARA